MEIDRTECIWRNRSPAIWIQTCFLITVSHMPLIATMKVILGPKTQLLGLKPVALCVPWASFPHRRSAFPARGVSLLTGVLFIHGTWWHILHGILQSPSFPVCVTGVRFLFPHLIQLSLHYSKQISLNLLLIWFLHYIWEDIPDPLRGIISSGIITTISELS